jgi:hypothetical protein
MKKQIQIDVGNAKSKATGFIDVSPYQRQQDRSALGYCGGASKIGGIEINKSRRFGNKKRQTAKNLPQMATN